MALALGTRGKSGRELFYVSPNKALMHAAVEPGGQFSFCAPEVLLKDLSNPDAESLGRADEISPDGKRFLVIRDATDPGAATAGPRLNVVLNWFEELKAKAPTK